MREGADVLHAAGDREGVAGEGLEDGLGGGGVECEGGQGEEHDGGAVLGEQAVLEFGLREGEDGEEELVGQVQEGAWPAQGFREGFGGFEVKFRVNSRGRRKRNRVHRRNSFLVLLRAMRVFGTGLRGVLLFV